MPEQISIEDQFVNYAMRVHLDKTKVSPVQYDETKKAFFAGASAMLLVYHTALTEMPKKEAELIAQKLSQEAEFYWKVNLM